jgi:hypothetical protein
MRTQSTMAGNTRRSRALLLAAACAVATAAPAFEESIRIAEAASVPLTQAPVPRSSHELRLWLYTFKGTPWRQAQILPAVQESARLLAQCGVSVASVELRVLEAPRRFHFFSTPVSRTLPSSLAIGRPALFFVEDTRNEPAFDAEAIGVSNSATRPELVNTVWVAYETRDLAHVLAHELVHVLSDSAEHTYEARNLMRPETSTRNVRLSDAQCRALRERGEANRLLTRRAR